MEKIYFSSLIVLFMSAFVFGLNGSGTEVDPYRIESLADFNEFTTDSNYWDDYIETFCKILSFGG